MKNKSSIVSASVFLLFPLVMLGIAVFLVTQVFDMKSKIENKEKENSVLEEKKQVLTNIRSEILSASGDIQTFLPADNPGAIVFSQVKTQANESLLLLSNLKLIGASTKASEGTVNGSVTFNLTGGFNIILSFLNGLQKSMPIMTVDTLKLSQDFGTGQASATVGLSFYWANLPSKITNITDPITNVDASQSAFLVELPLYRRSVFGEGALATGSATISNGRSDPFSQ